MEVPGLILILPFRGPNDDFCPIDAGNLVANIKDFIGKFGVKKPVKLWVKADPKDRV